MKVVFAKPFVNKTSKDQGNINHIEIYLYGFFRDWMRQDSSSGLTIDAKEYKIYNELQFDQQI